MDHTEMVNDHNSLYHLPGFRFHPTEEELVGFYLKNMVYGSMLRSIIGYLNIYLHEPWELPGLSTTGEREWYFFVPIERKNGVSGKPNRTTRNGFWKATGLDRKIMTLSDPKQVIGLRKTLVFYKGRAPRGSKTDWVMNEYRLPNATHLPKDIVLCKIYRKATPLRKLEQRAAIGEAVIKISNNNDNYLHNNCHRDRHRSHNDSRSSLPHSSPSEDDESFTKRQKLCSFEKLMSMKKKEEFMNIENNNLVEEKKPSYEEETSNILLASTNLQLPIEIEEYSYGKVNELQLQVPILSNTDCWSQDNFLLNSPWLQNVASYAHIFNF